jgi:putative transposase
VVSGTYRSGGRAGSGVRHVELPLQVPSPRSGWHRSSDQGDLRDAYSKTIRGDQGSEFVSCDLDLWAYAKGVTLDFSRPGKPTDNAYIEAFNGRFRAECLNAHWFLTLADAAEKLEDWRRYYSEVRPHGVIGHKVPISLLNPDGSTSPPS